MTDQTKPDANDAATDERRAFLAKAGKVAIAAPAAALLLAATQAQARVSGLG